MENPLRFHWSLAPSDFSALESTARAGIFESILLEPARAAPEEIASAIEAARGIPQLTLMVPFRYDSLSAEMFLAYAEQPHLQWLLACARLPFASRQVPFLPPHWHRESSLFLDRVAGAPLHVYGNTSEAAALAIKHADCLWRFAGAPEDAYAHALPILHFGKEVGLVASLVARPSREEALDAVRRGCRGTPVEWVSRQLCRCPAWPVNAPILAGSYEEVATTIAAWKRLGISRFLFASPDADAEIEHVQCGVLPLAREREWEAAVSAKA